MLVTIAIELSRCCLDICWVKQPECITSLNTSGLMGRVCSVK